MWIDVINRCGALQTNQKYQNSITLLNALQMAGVIVHIKNRQSNIHFYRK